MQTNPLWKKGWAVVIIVLFVAILFLPICAAQMSASHASKAASSPRAQGFDMVIIWGSFEEKVRKFPILSLEVRNRDPWDNRTINVFGLFKEGSYFHVYLVKSYWVDCVPLRSVHLGLVGQNSLFVVATGSIIVYP